MEKEQPSVSQSSVLDFPPPMHPSLALCDLRTGGGQLGYAIL